MEYRSSLEERCSTEGNSRNPRCDGNVGLGGTSSNLAGVQLISIPQPKIAREQAYSRQPWGGICIRTDDNSIIVGAERIASPFKCRTTSLDLLPDPQRP